MKTSFIIGASSDAGIIKEVNQDSIFAKIGENNEGEFALFVIADGMGGLSDGEIASRTCISFLKQWWYTELENLLSESSKDRLDRIGNSLEKLFYLINDKIIEYSQSISNKVGTTLSVLFVIREGFIIKHIGDSRIYRLRNRKLEQLTEDHSFVAQEVLAGRLTKEQARKHPKRNILTQCIGVHNGLNIFQSKGTVNDNDIFLLCSDGFYNKLTEKEITEYFLKNKDEDIDATIRNMIHVVMNREEKDNISCIAVNVKQSRSLFEKFAK